MSIENELNEVIASFTTNKGEVEVVKISHSAIDTLWLSVQLPDETVVTDETGTAQAVRFANMELSQESGGALLLSERTLTIQGVNDLIASQEDLIPTDSTERIKVSVLIYIVDNQGVISTVASGPFNYYVMQTTYSQKNNGCTFQVSTNPTNISETGERMSIAKFKTLAGFV